MFRVLAALVKSHIPGESIFLVQLRSRDCSLWLASVEPLIVVLLHHSRWTEVMPVKQDK